MGNCQNKNISQNNRCFSRFLSPISEVEFFEQIFEKQHHLFKRPSNYNDQFFSVADFTRLLTEQKFSRYDVSVAKNGIRRSPIKELHKPSKIVNPADHAQKNREFLADFRNGYTLVFEAFERYSKSIESIVNTLTNTFQCVTHTHAFFTPANAQGYKIHYDTDDAFILQISGRKRWQIYEGPEYLPSGPNRYDSSVHKPGKLLQDIILEPGDMLYIPRGVMHNPNCLEDWSLHLAIGIHTITWEDLLTEAINSAISRNPNLRSSVPFYKRDFHENIEIYREKFTGFLSEVSSESSFTEAAKHFNRFLTHLG